MNRLFIILGLVTALSCFAFGYWTGSRTPINRYQERLVYQDRVVVQHSEKHDDISTVKTQTVKKPDGTVIETKTTLVDKSVEKHSEREREKTQTTEVIQAESKNCSTYRLSVYLPPRWPVTSYKDVRVEVTRRLVGPLHVGAQVSLAGEVLVGLGVDF